jgi:translation initiation factor IF-3
MKLVSIQSSPMMWIVGLLAGIASTSAFVSPSLFGVGNAPATNNIVESQRSNVALFARRQNNNRQQAIRIPKPPMNGEIPPVALRVTIPNPPGKDEPLGTMTRDEALAKAKEMGGLDLILVNPHSDPPVCKIVDYSKYRYMQEKQIKEKKKNSKATEIKEVKMSYKIDVHDYDVRMKSALKFLKQGNRVKCSVLFRGREVQHDQLGFQLLDKLSAELDEVAVREGKPKREGRNLSLIIGPRPEVMKKIQENRRAEEKAKKKKKSEDKEQRASEKSAATSGAAAATMDAEEKPIDEEMDLESDIESSLDDLFGNDGLADDLFN